MLSETLLLPMEIKTSPMLFTEMHENKMKVVKPRYTHHACVPFHERMWFLHDRECGDDHNHSQNNTLCGPTMMAVSMSVGTPFSSDATPHKQEEKCKEQGCHY